MRYPRKIVVFDSEAGAADFLLEKWREWSCADCGQKGRFTAALSGGKTPVPFYRRLARKESALPWKMTHLFMVDERFVPADSPDSNYRMIKETLLNAIELPQENIHPIPTKHATPEESARAYGHLIDAFFQLRRGASPVFDLVILGMGTDGHTASLFPGGPCISERAHFACAADPGRGMLHRITLTLPVLNSARRVVFLVTGREKSEAMKRVIEEDDHSLPASLVTSEEGHVFFIVDTAAASLLKGGTYERRPAHSP